MRQQRIARRRTRGRRRLSSEPTESRILPLPLSEWSRYDDAARYMTDQTGRRHTAQDVIRRCLRVVRAMTPEEYERRVQDCAFDDLGIR